MSLRRLISVLALAIVALLLLAAPAFAVEAHLFKGSFGTSGSAAGQVSLVAPNYTFGEFSTGSGVAVNDETGNVYVADTGNHRVEEFSSAGSFIRAWGWGVATGAGEFQVCTATCQAGVSGSAPGQFESPLSIAIDNSGGLSNGDVYVADTISRAGPGTNLIQKFDPSGNLITGWASGGQLDGSTAAGGPFSEKIAGIATDESGNLFVNNLNRYVFEFDPDGTAGPSIAINGAEYPVGIGTDPSGAGNLYWTDNGNGTIDRLDSAGSNLGAVEKIQSGPGVPYQSSGFAVDPSSSDIYSGHSSLIRHFAIDASGAVVESDGTLCAVEPGSQGCPPTDVFGAGELSEAAGVAVDGETHDVYAADTAPQRIAIFRAGILADLTVAPATAVQKTSATLNGHLDPDGGTPVGECDFEYVTQEAFEETGFSDLSSGGSHACDQPTPISSATDLGATVTGLTAGKTYRARIAATNEFGNSTSPLLTVRTLDAVTAVTTEAATNVTNAGADLHGSFTGEEGLGVHYRFEYGTSTNYGHEQPVPPGDVPGSGTPTQAESVTTPITGLVSNTTYHFRLAAENSFGITYGEDLTFTTFQAPTIESFSTSEVTATSALLHARINPQGFETEYQFEFGTTPEYGQSTPEVDLGEGTTGVSVVPVRIENLQRGVTYHFRVVAHNQWGTVTTEDQTFEFLPPACPNAAVRQQTSSAYLPDCRAYELVSPGNANGTLLYSGGPTSPYATNPSRFAFTGAFSSLPEAPNTIGTDGDLYVATRTNTGWASHYIGLPGDRTGCMGGPPTNPESHTTHAEKIQDWVLTDSSMVRFLNFNLGTGANCYLSGNGTSDASSYIDLASNAPYLWSSAGDLLAHLPAGLESTPGAPTALSCLHFEGVGNFQHCSGDATASGDLTHFIFSSRTLSFSEPGQPGGLTEAPGSAYDEDVATGKITLISTVVGGGEIQQDPSFRSASFLCSNTQQSGFPECQDHEFIRFPGISTDGTHILMSTATALTKWCQRGNGKVVCPRFTDTPIHLYMSIDDQPAVEVSKSEVTGENVGVDYVGMTPDGSRVYFTSSQHLTGEDLGHGGAGLYMWSEKGEEEGHPLTLISKAAPGSTATAGNTENCAPVPTEQYDNLGHPLGEAPWTEKCGVVPYSGWSYANLYAGTGGNGHSDSAIAANGDIYFYSPEQLDGDRGVLNLQNLYDYREGSVHYVATFSPDRTCVSIGFTAEGTCADGPIARLEVTPDDTHMAFVSAERLTSYDNAGHLEMYSYTPATGAIVCDSCNPNGDPATADVQASQNGLFLTEDGRVFFSTTESLMPRDTNKGVDVYEFVNGRPQLITPGTGTAQVTGTTLVALEEQPGLVGVSASGSDVYFATYDTLLSEDHNGNFLKFYDARTGGGFLQPPPELPCEAAEECHGPGTETPVPSAQATAARLTGGNLAHAHRRRVARHRKKRHRKKHQRHHEPAVHRHGGRR